MYAYYLESKGIEVCGLLGYCELPDLKYNFEKIASAHGAKTTFLDMSGIIIAQKRTKHVFLSVRTYNGWMPGKQVLVEIDTVMDHVFGPITEPDTEESEALR